MDFQYIISYIISPELQRTIFPVKVFFLSVSGIFLIGIIYFLIITDYLETDFLRDWSQFFIFRSSMVRPEKKVTRVLNQAEKRLETGNESEYKLAIVEADSMLNELLEKKGYTGGTLGDKLKQVSTETLPDLNQIWAVHKIRNNIVHNPDYHLTLDQARQTLEIYERVLKTL